MASDKNQRKKQPLSTLRRSIPAIELLRLSLTKFAEETGAQLKLEKPYTGLQGYHGT